jgi:hypothetical protein
MSDPSRQRAREGTDVEQHFLPQGFHINVHCGI